MTSQESKEALDEKKKSRRDFKRDGLEFCFDDSTRLAWIRWHFPRKMGRHLRGGSGGTKEVIYFYIVYIKRLRYA